MLILSRTSARKQGDQPTDVEPALKIGAEVGYNGSFALYRPHKADHPQEKTEDQAKQPHQPPQEGNSTQKKQQGQSTVNAPCLTKMKSGIFLFAEQVNDKSQNPTDRRKIGKYASQAS